MVYNKIKLDETSDAIGSIDWGDPIRAGTHSKHKSKAGFKIRITQIKISMKKIKHKPAFEIEQQLVVPKFRIVGNGNCWQIERHDGEGYKPIHRDGSFIDMDQFELPFVYRNE